MNIFRRLTGKRKSLPLIDFRTKVIPFVSKSYSPGSVLDSFGGSVADYDRWRPYMCSTCCIKSVQDSLHDGGGSTLLQLIEQSLDLGVFKIEGDAVLGAFHYPLKDLLNSMNVPAQVSGSISEGDIVRALTSGRIVILSVDLRKSRHVRHADSHLILVHRVDIKRQMFVVHDSADAIKEDGNAAHISFEYLESLSNHKGLILG